VQCQGPVGVFKQCSGHCSFQQKGKMLRVTYRMRIALGVIPLSVTDWPKQSEPHPPKIRPCQLCRELVMGG
jgi:hypothetical protein